MHDLWFHVHVPKAGGSTLRQLMNRNFGKGYYNSVSLLESKQYTCNDVYEIAKSQPWLRCMSDHKLSLDLPYDFSEAAVHAYAFVREPVDRYISRYFYHRSADIECAAKTAADLRQFIDYELVQGHVEPHVRSQLCFLNQGRSFADMSVVQQALATNRAFLFPVERFDEAAVCLETMFPETFRDLSYVRVNQAERTQDLDQETTELLREQLADDLPVYELACQELERCIDQCFRYREDFEIALRDFQARGAVRRDNFNPLFLDRGLKTQKAAA